MLALYSVGFLLYYSVGLRQTPLSGSITNCPALFFVRNVKIVILYTWEIFLKNINDTKIMKNFITVVFASLLAIILTSCGGNTTNPSSQYNIPFKGKVVDCPKCVYGKCPHCDGTDVLIVYSIPINCPHCWGGKCSECGGDGDVFN